MTQIEVLVSELVHRTLTRRRQLAQHYRALAEQHPEVASSERLQGLLRELQEPQSRMKLMRDVFSARDTISRVERYHIYSAYYAILGEDLFVFDFVLWDVFALSDKVLIELDRSLGKYFDLTRTSTN